MVNRPNGAASGASVSYSRTIGINLSGEPVLAFDSQKRLSLKCPATLSLRPVIWFNCYAQ
jgi:hypothetical protein